MLLRFIIIPGQEVVQQIVSFAEKAKDLPGSPLLVVNGKPWLPHLTLCKVDIDEQRLDIMFTGLSIFFEQFNIFQLKLNNLMAEHEGTLGWDIEQNDYLQGLRDKLYIHLKEYALGEPLPLRVPYWPHFTIARYENYENAKHVADLLGHTKVEAFDVSLIAVALPGKLGQVSEVIKSFRL